VPLAIRPAGESCASAYTAVDFDGDPYAGSTPITLRVLDEDELSSPQLEAIDMRYSGCAGHAVFEVTQGALVGLLRKEETATAERCAQAASGASISGYLDIGDEREATDLGFEVGASLCAVTPTGRVARAKITRIIRPDYDLPAVEFELTTWVRSS
jgi:hypothetical protein